MHNKILILFFIVALYSCSGNSVQQQPAAADNSLSHQLDSIIKQRSAAIGVAIIGLEDKDSLFINGDKAYTIMSVVKFPQALAVLHKVATKELSLDQQLHFTKAELNASGYSPLKDSFPDGNINRSLEAVLKLAVSSSDNAACDKLFDLLGGPAAVETYLHQLGATAIGIGTTYARMKNDSVFLNHSTPRAMARLLQDFYLGNVLAAPQRDRLLDMMTNTSNDPKRIKGMLPETAVVAHKTGTSGTDSNQVTAAFNDAGIVTLPDGRHFVMVVFINNSKESGETNARTIAEISRAAWDYFVRKN